MAPLSTELRTKLGNAIKTARREAEAGAHKALQSLAVDRHEPHGSMTPEERKLRNRLRAHGRQLGDVRDKASGTQSIDRLAHEAAYEHWHRMLFARFLVENHLLVEPESGVTITMEECEELARDEGVDPRALAARFAQTCLPQIFRADDPVLEVELAPEVRQALDKLLENLPDAVFTADDSLGWTYQYWQAEKKDAVNESGNKIGADELPAVTQLFTEHYMVLFLYHNTIGAWHAGKMLAANPSIENTAQTEEELREAVRLHSGGGYDFEYLRFVREPLPSDEDDQLTGPWRPAAGAFEGWPKTAKELKVLDPCCGSGHFLVEGFEILVRLRMDEEELTIDDAVRAVLDDNLFGLEIDLRCTQIAAFNVAMTAWKLSRKVIELPSMHIACSGLALGSNKADWTKPAGNDDRLRAGMERLYDLFEQAPELGSLIDPHALKGDMFEAEFAELQPLIVEAAAREPDDLDDTERAVAAQGMARAADLLARKYTLVATNVPYLGRKLHSDVLREFASEHYPKAKSDLAMVLLFRLLHILMQDGTLAAVTPQNWFFLSGYRAVREQLLRKTTLDVVVNLGTNAFREMNWWAATTALVIISRSKPTETKEFYGFDVGGDKVISNKATFLATGVCGVDAIHDGFSTEELTGPRRLKQADQSVNPDSRIVLSQSQSGPLLSEYAESIQGSSMIDIVRFRPMFWEVDWLDEGWSAHQSSPNGAQKYSGLHYASANHETRRDIHDTAASLKLENRLGGYRSGRQNIGRRGVTVAWVGRLPASLYGSCVYDHNTAVVVPKDDAHLGAIWSFVSSDSFVQEVRRIDQKLIVTNATLVKVPFDLAQWQETFATEYPDGLPQPQSDDPTQWLFHGHPAKAEPSTALQVAVGRLLGYRWPPGLDSDMHLADQAREWVGRCDELKDFADEDGIVCLSPTRGERAAADRLRALLAVAFGSDWSAAKERQLLAVAGDGKKPAASLEVWLREKFFEEHCKLFHHRPFIWHIWDGEKTGFHCLVNAHKLTGSGGEARRTLEAITYSYLKDWMDRQRSDQLRDIEGADARVAAAQDLQRQLGKVLRGEPPYDLFVRWKALDKQPIGWEPDANDGVRLNIRPFMKAELQKGGKKGAGILRWKPNIKWAKDRGKEPQSIRPKEAFPWYWGCEGDGADDDRMDFAGGASFDGNRWNDLHYTNEFKSAARDSSDEGTNE